MQTDKMRNPLDQFAARLIRCHEIEYFINGLIDLGVSPKEIQDVLNDREQKSGR